MNNKKILKTVSIAAVAVCASVGSLSAQSDSKIKYPETRKGDQVDDYHGTSVADPYRWLEDTDSPETRAWINAQNEITSKFLSSIPQRDAIRSHLDSLWDFEKYSTPSKRGGKYFYTYNSGLLNQSVLYVQDNRQATPRVLLDPNALAADGTVALSGYAPSPNGRYLAYSVAVAGSDWNEVRIRDVETGADLADTVSWIKFSSPSWTKDEKGFLYARYQEPKSDRALQEVVRDQKIYYHVVGTSQAEDVLVHERSDRPDWIWSNRVTNDGRYLILSAYQGSDPTNRVFYIDLKDPDNPQFDGPVVELLGAGDATYDFVGNLGSIFYFRTDNGAPKGRIVAIDVNNSAPSHWHTVVAESEDALSGATVIAGHLFTVSLHDAYSVVHYYKMPAAEGVSVSSSFGPKQNLELPSIGSLAGLSGQPDDDEIFYGFMSYLSPVSIYEYDVKAGKSTVFRAPELGFNPDDYETKQVFYNSKDGTRIPMFITMKKGTVLDGANPTILYGYGGFNISLTPSFNARTIVWLEMGGIYAVANMRGGGEYGTDWHRAGTRERKQNVFDDFIAAAEYLIDNKYTSTPRLAINGGSNGGLLVGAVVNQRPDLFGAAIPEVGVMDMLRFQKFTIGWAWTSDYGSSDDPEQFKTLYRYSPLHNLRAGTKYPPVLVMTADHDDRVVPGHSFKYAAALQAAQGGDAPALIRIETKAGHGAGKPTSKQIDEAADRFAFLVKTLNMTLPADF